MIRDFQHHLKTHGKHPESFEVTAKSAAQRAAKNKLEVGGHFRTPFDKRLVSLPICIGWQGYNAVTQDSIGCRASDAFEDRGKILRR